MTYEDTFLYDFNTNQNTSSYKSYAYGANGRSTYATQPNEQKSTDIWAWGEETGAEGKRAMGGTSKLSPPKVARGYASSPAGFVDHYHPPAIKSNATRAQVIPNNSPGSGT